MFFNYKLTTKQKLLRKFLQPQLAIFCEHGQKAEECRLKERTSCK